MRTGDLSRVFKEHYAKVFRRPPPGASIGWLQTASLLTAYEFVDDGRVRFLLVRPIPSRSGSTISACAAGGGKAANGGSDRRTICSLVIAAGDDEAATFIDAGPPAAPRDLHRHRVVIRTAKQWGVSSERVAADADLPGYEDGWGAPVGNANAGVERTDAFYVSLVAPCGHLLWHEAACDPGKRINIDTVKDGDYIQISAATLASRRRACSLLCPAPSAKPCPQSAESEQPCKQLCQTCGNGRKVVNVKLFLDGSCICAFNDPNGGGVKIKVEGRWCCRKGKSEESRKASCAVCDEIRPAVCEPIAERVAAKALCRVCRS